MNTFCKTALLSLSLIFAAPMQAKGCGAAYCPPQLELDIVGFFQVWRDCSCRWYNNSVCSPGTTNKYYNNPIGLYYWLKHATSKTHKNVTLVCPKKALAVAVVSIAAVGYYLYKNRNKQEKA